MGIPALRQHIDAKMHLAPTGDAVRICCVYNFKILFRKFFSVRYLSSSNAYDTGAMCQ
jgi:hypothetical protein